MAIHCSGKQGAHLRVSGNGISPVDIVTGGGAVSEQSSSIRDGFATWRVYTATTVNGRVIEAYRGVHSKLHAYSFYIWKPSATSNRLTHTGAPNGSLVSWTSSTTSWISRIEFSHGDPLIWIYRTRVLSSSGSVLFDRSSESSAFSVSELACGCDNSDCQHGIFPTNFCCTNCAQQSGLLQEIISALQARNNG